MTNISILEAKNLLKDNKYLEAINLLESLPDDRYKFYELAKAFLKIGDFDKAVNNISKVIEIKNDWPGAYAIAGNIYLKINNHAEAVSNFSKAIKVWPKDEIDKIDSFYQDICNLLFSELSGEKLFYFISNINSLMKIINPNSSSAKLYEGILGQINADENYLSFRRLKHNDIVKLDRHASGALSIADIDSYKYITNYHHAEKSYNLPKWSNIPSYIYLISCDNKYFLIFSDVLLNSFLRNERCGGLLVHVLNPSSLAIKKIESIDDPRIRFVTNDADYNKKSFYACSRFLMLPSVLECYNKPVIVVDIDSCFVGDCETEMGDLLKKYDFSIKVGMQKKLSHYCWRQYAAGFSVFQPSLMGKLLARKIAALIDYFGRKYEYSDNIWYVDQSAISVVMRNEMNNPDASLGKLGSITSKVIIYPDASNGSKDEFVNKHKLSISREAIE